MRYTLIDEEDPSGNGDITLILSWEPVTDIDINDVLSIKVHNVWGEKATAPAFLNQLGLLRADANRKSRVLKLERDCLYAELYEKCEDGLTITDTVNKKLVDKAPSSAKVEAAVKRMPEYKKACMSLINAETVAEQIEGIYWAMVAKIKQLGDFKTDLKPIDLLNEIVEEQVNGFSISKQDGRFSVRSEKNF